MRGRAGAAFTGYGGSMKKADSLLEETKESLFSVSKQDNRKRVVLNTRKTYTLEDINALLYLD